MDWRKPHPENAEDGEPPHMNGVSRVHDNPAMASCCVAPPAARLCPARPQPDEWEPDEQQLQSFTAFYKDTNGGLAVCSNNNIATGNALGVALISEGVGVSESLELIESAHPTALETMGQIEYLYMAADMLGFDLDLD
jgi:hypothetical protein